ncbi:MAG: hypothetical protein DWP95_06510 [Proteobacteria bacterium]|nr:MAG: hypothetical protein DWP95_06510 [Pseudomonadota bacterium]
MIGAPYSRRGGLGHRKGAVYIYLFNGINWVENQILASGYKHFGFDISINGDKMLIGAPETIEIGSDKAGSVFVYENINSVWVETDHLLAPIGNQSEWFGSSVSLSDTWALIGSPSDNTNGYRAGAAQLYHLINGIWVEDIKIFPADPAANDYFGDDVAIDNNKIVIGAHRKQFTNYSRLGAVFAYNFDGNLWQQQQKIMPSDLTDNKYFGSAVALNGETLMIGAQSDGELANGSGAAYQFSLSNDQWVESNKIFAPDAAQGDQFGYALDISSADKLIVSAIHDDDHGPQSGAVHIYQLNVGDLIYQNSFESNQ